MLHKLQHKIIKIIFLMALLLIEGHLFAQDTEAPKDANPTQVIKEEDNLPQEEGHDTKDLEKLLKNYNTDSAKVLEDASKIEKIQEGQTKSEVNEAAIEGKDVGSEEFIPDRETISEKIVRVRQENDKKKPEIMSSDFSKSIAMALEPLQKLSEKDLLKRLDESTKESPMRPYMDQFPNITLFSVRLIKDKESIPSLAKIVENKDRLIHFAAAMICTIIFGFILKRLMHQEGRSFIKAVAYFFLRTIILMILRMALVFYFFSAELAPAVKVFNKTFL